MSPACTPECHPCPAVGCGLLANHLGPHRLNPAEQAHATSSKYATLGDLEAKLAPGEPVFSVRGQDLLAPGVVQVYAEALRKVGRDDAAAQVEALGIEFLRWQAHNRDRVKLPD